MATYAKNQLHMQIAADPDQLADNCLHLFTENARKAIKANGAFRVAISGGNSPKHFFEYLGMSEESKKLPWEKVHLFWVDERYVEPDSHWSNYKLAKDTFLQQVNIPEKNIHRIPTEQPDSTSAARMYEKTLRSVFGISNCDTPEFDLIILGMGTDGHTGSLFSGSYANICTDDLVSVVYTLDETLNRITLTGHVITAAKNIAVLVAGKQKAKTLYDVLNQEPDEVRYPIHLLWPVLDKVTWLVDKQAASLLKK